MQAIRLESFRSLADTGFVRLRPLTLLVGRNSSGKSTFLRFLPLLRQSVETRTSGPIQWYGEYVDFGGFAETLATFSSERTIRLGFEFQLDLRPLSSPFFDFDWPRLPGGPPAPRARLTPCQVLLTLGLEREDARVAQFTSVVIKAAGHSIELNVELPGRLARLVVNGSQPLEHVTKELSLGWGPLLPTLRRRSRDEQEATVGIDYRFPFFRQPLAPGELTEALRPLFHHRTSKRKIVSAARRLLFDEDKEILARLKSHSERGRIWRQNVGRLQLTHTPFRKIRDLVVANSLGAVLEQVDEQIRTYAAGVRYSKPVRATAERYYRQQDLAVEEVDAEGQNLAAFLSSLGHERRRDFERWTSSELGWRIVTSVEGGHISVRIQEGDGESYNLADVGFGFSQILPVLAQLWSIQRRSAGLGRGRRNLTFAIEQPELHLHPALQARIADVMIRAVASAKRNNVGLTLVVETHSEAIVNRLGHLIATKKMDPEDATVVLFDSEGGDGPSGVRVSDFGRDGRLRDWPFGFFDPE